MRHQPPRTRTERDELNDRLRAVRSEIATYSAPSTLGDAHDRHVRARWDAHVAELRAFEAELLAQRADLPKENS